MPFIPVFVVEMAGVTAVVAAVAAPSECLSSKYSVGVGLVCFMVAFFLVVSGGVPGEALFIELDHHLWAAHVGLSSWNQISFVGAAPAGRRRTGEE